MNTISRTCLAALCAASLATLCAAQPADAGKLKGAAAEKADKGLGMALLSAAVDTLGTLHQNVGAIAATRTSTGNYTIQFARPVDTCNYASTSGFWAPLVVGDQTAQVSVSPADGNPKAVVIRTNGPAGTPSDANFHVLVFCGP